MQLVVDFEAFRVTVGGEPAANAARARAAPLLIQNKQRVVLRERRPQRLWGYDRQVDTR